MLREAKQKEKEAELAKKIQQLQPLGEDDGDEQEREEPPEQLTSAAQEKAIDKKETPAARNKRYELERRRKDKAAREAEKAKANEQAEEELQKSKSPARKKGKSPGRGKAKTDQKETDKSTPGTSKPKIKSLGRQSGKTKDKKDHITDNRTKSSYRLFLYLYTCRFSQSEENNENQLKMACLDPNGMLNSCQNKPKYVKVNDILTDRFDSSDESKSRFIM